LEASGGLPEVPPELDARCRKMIADARANGRRKEMVIGFFKTAGRWAAILMITVGILTTLVFSVEALRIPVVNFIIEQHERFSTIIVNKNDEQTVNTDPTSEDGQRSEKGPLAGLLPASYVLSKETVFDNGTFMYTYCNEAGEKVTFVASLSNGTYTVDTEDANCEDILLKGCKGVLVIEGSARNLLWYDESSNMMYNLFASEIEEADFWGIAEELAEKMMRCE